MLEALKKQYEADITKAEAKDKLEVIEPLINKQKGKYAIRNRYK